MNRNFDNTRNDAMKIYRWTPKKSTEKIGFKKDYYSKVFISFRKVKVLNLSERLRARISTVVNK